MQPNQIGTNEQQSNRVEEENKAPLVSNAEEVIADKNATEQEKDNSSNESVERVEPHQTIQTTEESKTKELEDASPK